MNNNKINSLEKPSRTKQSADNAAFLINYVLAQHFGLFFTQSGHTGLANNTGLGGCVMQTYWFKVRKLLNLFLLGLEQGFYLLLVIPKCIALTA